RRTRRARSPGRRMNQTGGRWLRTPTRNCSPRRWPGGLWAQPSACMRGWTRRERAGSRFPEPRASVASIALRGGSGNCRSLLAGDVKRATLQTCSAYELRECEGSARIHGCAAGQCRIKAERTQELFELRVERNPGRRFQICDPAVAIDRKVDRERTLGRG